MAISKDIWERIKADYELGNIEEDKAFSQLSKSYLVDRSTISKKALKDKWIYGKNSHISHLEVSTLRDLQKINHEKSQLNHTELIALDNKTRLEAEREGINQDTFRLAKAIQTKLFEAIDYINIDGLRPKEITSSLKDINDIVNPQSSKIEVNNQNNQQNNIIIEIE